MTDALQWVWGEELPKVGAGAAGAAAMPGAKSAWASIDRFGSLHAIIDRPSNVFGCVPFDEAEAPHPDAIAIADAVFALDSGSLVIPDGWDPVPEIADCDRDLKDLAIRDALERVSRRPSTVVIRFAILGRSPDWAMDRQPVALFEKGPTGADRWFVRRETRMVEGQNPDGSDRIVTVNAEVDGWSQRLRRPVAGAYRKRRLDPDPRPAIVARAEYEIFVACLAMLFDDLKGELASIDLKWSPWPLRPWEDGSRPAGPRILPQIMA
ncbi:hypothetical protein CSC94_11715 [Zhengella mangrovi]|uniref:Uncharacterized protein n=1 Tax=Zhengella mangrovi TaxID=1982044 RepID=A0A2G1QNI4_9HYPH|nr:hypothetical protein [Zhengella mangrovi]PHP66768.1 hypothetical protein CSC94_11715 [Zhengella mangrovi]